MMAVQLNSFLIITAFSMSIMINYFVLVFAVGFYWLYRYNGNNSGIKKRS